MTRDESEQPAVVDYRSPVDQNSPRPIGPALGMAAWVFFDAVVLSIALAVGTLKFEQVFKDFKVDLPGITKLWLTLSRWFTGYGWLLLWGGAISLIVVVLVARPPLRKDRGSGWSLLFWILRFGWIPIVIIAVLALFLPYISLIETVSSPPKR